METIVISLGGSMINPEGISVHFIKEFRYMIKELKQDHRFVIVCGGGNSARKYIKALHELGIDSDHEKDWMGIAATKINSELIMRAFKDDAYKRVITNPTEKIDEKETEGKVIIASGWKPGFSTDMIAILLAKQLNAKKVINISNIDHVYDSDPRVNPEAKRFESISWDDYISIIGEEWKPGLSTPFDPIASKEAKNNNIEVCIISPDLENIKDTIFNRQFKGTTIS